MKRNLPISKKGGYEFVGDFFCNNVHRLFDIA